MNLQWTNSKKTKLLNSYEFSGSTGRECFFVRTSKYSGVKLYSNKRTRDFCWKNQQLAERKNLGPRTGCKFIVRDKQLIDYFKCIFAIPYNKKVLYGYVTEALQRSARSVPERQIENLSEKLLLVGLVNSARDLIEANVGIDRNGKLKCLDFGDMVLDLY